MFIIFLAVTPLELKLLYFIFANLFFIIDIYNNLGAQIKEMERKQADSAAKIQEYMGTAESGIFSCGKVSWKTQERSTFDRKKFESERGKIDPQYFKKSTSRPFKIMVKEN